MTIKKYSCDMNGDDNLLIDPIGKYLFLTTSSGPTPGGGVDVALTPAQAVNLIADLQRFVDGEHLDEDAPKAAVYYPPHDLDEDDARTIFEGNGFQFTRTGGKYGGFYKLDNNAEHGGAWIHGHSLKQFAVALAAEAGLKVVDGSEPVAEAKAKVKAVKPKSFSELSPLASKVLQHIRRAGSISAREAMADHGITSASLARRICDLEEAGINIKRERRKHPMTHQHYTRYSIAA